MYQNTALQNYIETSSSVSMQSTITAEWNLNFPDNVHTIGNYKYRAGDATFGTLQSTFVEEDSSTATKYYFDGTDSAIISNIGIDSGTSAPITSITPNQIEPMLYSLNDCLGRFRPRSGINKLRFWGNNFINYPNKNIFSQPRFYLSSKDDKFKYWDSFRTDSTNVVRGRATVATGSGDYKIEDANPFVVYRDAVPANRIVVKMQTGVSDTSFGTYKKSNNKTFSDPFYENPLNVGNLVNQQTPAVWSVQYLDLADNWVTAKSFTLNQVVSGKRVIPANGYVELAYGITGASATFKRLLGEYPSLAAIQYISNPSVGDGYLVPDDTYAEGTVYVWNGANWTSAKFRPIYDWYLNNETMTSTTSIVTELNDPKFYGTVGGTVETTNYREFKYIKGIRLAVQTMSKQDSIFSLIEMSPRLVADLSDKTTSFSVKKVASDIGNTGVPVGQLLAATGNLEIFDYDQSFNESNVATKVGSTISGSIVSNISSKNLQIKFHEQIIDNRDASNITTYFVPVKTMYVDGFPKFNTGDRKVSLELRDLMFYFETITTPSIMLKNVRTSVAIATLLDNIGFSNYQFYRNSDEEDDIIPYFYVAPENNVAEVLNDLAQSTQTAMFFDEDNNFITMSRNYIMPSVAERATDITLYGTADFSNTGVQSNYTVPGTKLANIISIGSEDGIIYNGGKITYSNKYIQKSYGKISEASMLNNSQSFKYKPVLLWEVAGTEALRPTNDEVGNQSSYSMSALALNATLSDQPPSYTSGVLSNYVMDFGQSIYWLTRYTGYFYANGEIIKYDAVEHTTQSTPVIGLSADIVSGQSTVTLLAGNIYNLEIGQTLATIAVGGYTGAFGASPKITAIDIKNNTITLSVAHATTGAINFTTTVAEHNVWITSVSDYQKYFAKLPFNGKMYPTGRVRIFSEPDYDVNGNLVNGIAKHGRGQFGTKVVTHTVLNKDHPWLDKTKAKAFLMDSKWIFSSELNHSYSSKTVPIIVKAGGIANGATTITVDDSSTIGAGTPDGYFLTGSNRFQSGTQVKSKTKTILTLNKATSGGSIAAGAEIFASNRLLNNLSKSSITTPFSGTTPTVLSTSKNMFDSSLPVETTDKKTLDSIKANGSIKASALTIVGVGDVATEKPLNNKNDFVSYVYKNFSSEVPNANCFGTRMRIVGQKVNDSDKAVNAVTQIPLGADFIDSIANKTDKYTISGTGGGIAFNLNVANAGGVASNVGYYFEIDALTSNAIINEVDSGNTIESIPNVFFYKVLNDTGNEKSVPVVLYYGSAPIFVDDGLFSGMGKMVGETSSTVYDLSVEMQELRSNPKTGLIRKKFYLYFNNKIIATVIDEDALATTENSKNMALFVRGSGKAMFEHAYIIGDNPVAAGVKQDTGPDSRFIFSDNKLDNDSYRKYLVNPAVLNTYVESIGSSSPPKYKLHYEEFGTLMRECAYFNVKYDKAYPALYSKISPTFNDRQAYVVSNFRANPYTAEFLLFNITDFAVNLDESTGNYLRIQGITFTQQSSHDLTVDEYFKKNSDLSSYGNYGVLNSSYTDIQNSRMKYGKQDFSLTGTYIQSIATAESLMDWMVRKVMKPKKSIGLDIFANPMIRLGDIVTITYSQNSVDQVASPTDRFVVYHIDYSRSPDGPTMSLYLSEVI
jgi:hypothetical protein